MDLPPDLTYGYALGSWIEAWGDSISDADRLPDRRPAVGTVKIVPDTTFITSSANGMVLTGVIPKPVNCTIGDDGLLRDEAQGVGVFLITGDYKVTVNIVGDQVRTYPIRITAANTIEAPFDLVAAMEITPGTKERFVVNEANYLATLAAEARAEDAADRAETAAAAASGSTGGTRVITLNGRSGVVTLTPADVLLDKVNNTADADKPVSTAQALALGGKAPTAHTHTAADITNGAATFAAVGRNVATDGVYLTGGGTLAADRTLTLSTAARASLAKADTATQPSVLATALATKADLVNGLISTSQIPAIALMDIFPVTSQAAMLASGAQKGDIALRSDVAATYILNGADPTVLSNWLILPVPAGGGGAVNTVNGQTGTVVLGKADIGLGNVSNLAPADLPVSTATTTALGLKIDASVAGNNSVYVKNSGGSVTGLAYTSAPTGSTIMLRDAAGNTQVAATPVNTTDATSKSYTDAGDALQVPRSTAVASTVYAKDGSAALVGLAYAQTATAGALAQRGTGGILPVPAVPTNDTDAASKQYVDRIGDHAAAATANVTTAQTLTGVSGFQRFVLGASIAIALPATNPSTNEGFTKTLTLVQDATGGRIITWPAALKWNAGVKPVLSTAANAIDVFTLMWNGSEWIGFFGAGAVA